MESWEVPRHHETHLNVLAFYSHKEATLFTANTLQSPVSSHSPPKTVISLGWTLIPVSLDEYQLPELNWIRNMTWKPNLVKQLSYITTFKNMLLHSTSMTAAQLQLFILKSGHLFNVCLSCLGQSVSTHTNRFLHSTKQWFSPNLSASWAAAISR